MAQMVKNLPVMQETQVQSLGWEDLQEKGMDTHSSILAWRIPWTEEPGGLQSMRLQRVVHDWVTKHTHGNQDRGCSTQQWLETAGPGDEEVELGWDKTGEG